MMAGECDEAPGPWPTLAGMGGQRGGHPCDGGGLTHESVACSEQEKLRVRRAAAHTPLSELEA